jgi:translation initiation factor IF-2
MRWFFYVFGGLIMAEQSRPPIVTILGHVDHGKTTLLDYIRSASVAAREHGGITQAIGAYQAEKQGKLITFIDTPGHAAFEKMRSRGANVADIAVLVVAADDGIMPQTVEAIKHIIAAKVPMVAAVNKVDLPGINLQAQMERIKKQLSDNNVLVEQYGGDVPIVEVSAKTGLGVDTLLETILLIAEIHELKSDPAKSASAVVIESRMDKFKGPIATILVRDGSLKKGDKIDVAGTVCKVRSMLDFTGKQVDVAGPSMPVEVHGWETVPPVGAAIGDEAKKAEEKAATKSLIEKLRDADNAVLNVIVKADKQGSLEAIETALQKFNEAGEHLKIILSGTGDISESDVELAATTHSIVLGFNSNPTGPARKIAENQLVLIRTYTIIYELLDEVNDVMQSLLEKGALEEILAQVQVLAEFPYGKSDRIAGCRVIDGTLTRGPKIRVVRNDAVVAEGKIKSIKKGKEEAVRIERGQECGLMFDGNLDFQVGDIIESYRTL